METSRAKPKFLKECGGLKEWPKRGRELNQGYYKNPNTSNPLNPQT